MNPIDRSLQRLLDAARRARPEAPRRPPAALEQQVLARWRSAPAEEDFTLLFGLFRQAAICAVIIMTLSAGWTWFHTRNETSAAVALANYALTLQEPP